MYALYIGFWFKPCLSCSSSQSESFMIAENFCFSLKRVWGGILYFNFPHSSGDCSSSARVTCVYTLNATSPLPFGLSPIAQTHVIFLHDLSSFARGEVGTRIDRYRSLIMPPSFVRRLRNNMAQSDGTTVKLGAQKLAAVAARNPSSNMHIPCISTLRIG